MSSGFSAKGGFQNEDPWNLSWRGSDMEMDTWTNDGHSCPEAPLHPNLIKLQEGHPLGVQLCSSAVGLSGGRGIVDFHKDNQAV